MKKVSKTLAIVLCLVMILSLTALAAWPMYQGDINHTGQITDAAPHITSNPTVSYLPLPANGSGWSGVDSEPVMQSVLNQDDTTSTYAYVLYNGRSDGGTIAKIDCDTGSIVWTEQATTTAANQLSTPLLVGNSLYYVYNIENQQASRNDSGKYTYSQNVSITTSLAAGGSYRLYVPSKMTETGTTTLKVKVKKPDNSTVYLNVDNDDPAETGGTTVRTLTTDTSTSYLNKNYANVFANAGSYTITFEYTRTSGKYAIGNIVLYRNNITLAKINDVNATSPVVSTVSANLPGAGQMNTPVTTDGTYIYFGTWMSGSAHGRYFQVKISDGTYKSYMPSIGNGFYWAGAVPIDKNGDNANDYIVFGGDGGYLYYRSISDFENVGGVYDLSSLGSVTAGNVRSTVSSDGTYIYFTSQGPTGTSYLWRFLISTIGNTTPTYNVIALDGGTSTSTPAISKSGLIYVGYYNGFTSGGIDVVESTSNTFAIVKNISGLPPVQSSVDVYYKSGYDYIFFTTNANAGAGYCYSINISSHAETALWNTTSVGNNTCLQGMAACNGYLTFGNDSNRFFIVNP